MSDFMSVIEAVNVGDSLGFVVNPDFMDLMPHGGSRKTVERILNGALHMLSCGEIININYTPHFNMLLTIAVDGSGVIKIDASGSTPISRDELTEVINFIIQRN